jgi:hypothetical protein
MKIYENFMKIHVKIHEFFMEIVTEINEKFTKNSVSPKENLPE